MKVVFATITATAAMAIALIVYYVPFGVPTDICRPVARWTGVDGQARSFDHPMGLAWRDGMLYVVDTENGAVKKYRDDGTFVAAWTGFERPVDVAVGRDAIYVADFLQDRISKLRPDGIVVAQWGHHGSGPGEFDAPGGIAMDGAGFIYVTDFYNHRVQKFTGDGTFVMEWGRNGRLNGEFHYPTGIAVSPESAIYVADAYNHRIEKFTDRGEYLTKWGGTGYGISGGWPGWFRLAKAVALDRNGNAYVADAFNHRIEKFTAEGHLLGIWRPAPQDPAQLRYPAGVATDVQGGVYVTDFFENVIWKLECR
jgi:tripartite motif-containing protein 71